VARDLPVPRRDVFRRTALRVARRSAGQPAVVRSRGSPMGNPFVFIQQVRAETSKVTWPTRRETLITSALVILMVFAASLFFIAVDQTIRIVLGWIMTLGR